MGRVYNTSSSADSAMLLKSKLTKNFNGDNYWIEGLQNKVNAAWDFTTDRVDIEEETDVYKVDGYKDAHTKYHDLEVRITSAYDEKGMKLSDDYKNIIFKDVQHDQRLGRKYRFDVMDFEQPDVSKKCTWLNINFDTVQLGENAIIRRCTQNLGFLINGDTEEWYEPAIIDYDAKYTINYFNSTLNIVRSECYAILQFNEYTKDIEVNDRFIIGAMDFDNKANNQVYKVKEVFRFGALYTDNPNSIPLTILALDRDVINDEDDYIAKDSDGTLHYIANYFSKVKTSPQTKPEEPDNQFIRISPNIDTIYETQSQDFVCNLYNQDNEIIPCKFDFTFKLTGTNKSSLYFSYEVLDDNTLRITNLRKFFKSDLQITCIPVGHEDIEPLKFNIQLGELL